MNPSYVIGLDECGTGELAGPMAVCAFWCNARAASKLRGFSARDSKSTSPEYREKFRALVDTLRDAGHAAYFIALAHPEEIAAKGVHAAWDRLARTVVHNAVQHLDVSPLAVVELHVDGNHPVPDVPDGVEQHVAPRLDDLDVRVSAASIMAKESLDRYWKAMDAVLPDWNFTSHRGAASPHHITMLKAHGTLPGIHRQAPVETLMKTLSKGGGPRGLIAQ